MKSNPNGEIKINYANIPDIGPTRCNKCFYNVLIHELGHMVDFTATLRVGVNPLPGGSADSGSSLLGAFAAAVAPDKFGIGSLQTGLGFISASRDENGRYSNAELVADIIGNWFAGTIDSANMEQLAEAIVHFARLTDPQILEEILEELLEGINGML